MGYKLLLADDSITIQKVVSIIFANEECELTIVDNGDAALEKAREMLPDIMLVDTLMPGLNGYEVCEHIRRDPTLSSAPLLLLTGAFEPFDVDKARVSGADDYISKPFESQILIEKVNELVQIGRERRSSVPAAEHAPSPAVSQEAPFTFTSAPEQDFFPVETPPLEPQAADKPAWSEDSSVPGWGEAPQNAMLQDEAPSVTPVEDFGWVLETTDNQQNPGAFFSDGTEPMAAAADSLPLAEDIVEASPEDDLWGAFSLEAADEDGSDASDIIETYTVEDAPSIVDTTEYSFSEEDFGGRAEAPAGELPDIAAAWDLPEEPAQLIVPGLPASHEEDASAFGDTMEPSAPSDVLSAFSDDQGEEPAAGDEAPVSEEAYFFTDAVEPAPFAGAVEVEPEPESSTPVDGQPGSSAGAGEAAGSLAGSSGASAVTVTEEQLATMLSKISREVIERIVWEVVPDLAETLIKEEIRRIKEGR